ncbi:hypothetical protein FNF27_06523 [Cafeteria roenbergensis]|uniref:Phosphatidylinositol-3,4,5-trisphosphate 3-phosphatase n=2 Tax=Cafeteria roenbergensis TaxID=33653 RepID=A0A5A8DYU6_CAFRO|nr:hypothetical protein FNF29_03830 [Cafeteria roenbergensis]KAA0161710.1 hypothetical protein FNF31_03653 [Cafeteria roenbergensis]KAA0165217.1 hypothetical protein FNF28_03498 [Cafeteria roenbergensis]KAA0170635.1 hypothetical protein FNF27_06523 [Cafeteria roenbergensis]|eukprot:KAA0152603.1 hypothetical protein FNF29_03830 [Cafeteria roenbergensis]
MASMMRSMVSKKKKRYEEDGFDLDLTYITDRIIAMGFPSTGSEASYRNPVGEVQRFFAAKHKGKFRVYNLCSERCYTADTFEKGGAKPELGGGELGGQCAYYPFDDHNPAPLETIKACCDDMAAFLDADAANVVAVHCKAGKGRTGMIISAFLVHCGAADNATDALQYFGNARTHNGKGVTIPSQMRYVHYYHQCLQIGALPAAKTYRIRHFRLHTIPNLDPLGGCDPYFDARLAVLNDAADPSKGLQMRMIYNFFEESKRKVPNYKPKHRYADLSLEGKGELKVKGDVKIVFYDFDRLSADDKAFHFWFNTGFVYNNYLLLHKDVIDRACKDKGVEFDADFKVEVFLEELDEDMDVAELGAAVEDDREDPAGDDDEEVPAAAAAAASAAE